MIYEVFKRNEMWAFEKFKEMYDNEIGRREAVHRPSIYSTTYIVVWIHARTEESSIHPE